MLISFILLVFAAVTTTQRGREYTRTSLGESIDVATMKLLKVIYENGTDKSVVVSPLGLMILLSLYNWTLDSAAEAEINQFLGATDAGQTTWSFQQLSNFFSDLDPETLSVANRISVSDRYTLDEIFSTYANEYKIQLDKLDFTKPEESAAIINQWASEKTNGHITEPVSKDTLTPNTLVALLSVVYFKGHWRVPFKKEETTRKDFHVSRDRIVKKPMMHIVDSMSYLDSRDLRGKILEIPYRDGEFHMVVVMPNESEDLPSVLHKAIDYGILRDVVKLSESKTTVELYMPIFDIKSKLDFNDILPKLGVSKLFNEPQTGNVKNMPVKVSKVFQEAYIKVNEEGATAGESTGSMLVRTSFDYKPPPSVKFIADHPFLYFILMEDIIIFAGIYSGQ